MALEALVRALELVFFAGLPGDFFADGLIAFRSVGFCSLDFVLVALRVVMTNYADLRLCAFVAVFDLTRDRPLFDPTGAFFAGVVSP
jgi:hypothetical protein